MSEETPNKKEEAWEIAYPALIFYVQAGFLPPNGVEDVKRAIAHYHSKNEPVETSNWLDMTTAPKDGTRILVHDGENCYVVSWLNGSTARRGRAFMEWAVPESWQDEQGGYTSIDAPLGWMPLPNIKKSS